MGDYSNGVQDGIENAQRFVKWKEEVKDFKPFIYQGTLSISRMARECGLNRDVFYTNPDIRDRHLPTLIHKLEQDGVLMPRIANPVEVVRREPRRSGPSDARIKQIQEENEALRAENGELRQRLAKYEGMDAILSATGRLPW